MKKLQLILERLNRTEDYVGIAIFAIMILSCVVQMFFRLMLNNSLSWTEELARYRFISIHMLGASLL